MSKWIRVEDHIPNTEDVVAWAELPKYEVVE